MDFVNKPALEQLFDRPNWRYCRGVRHGPARLPGNSRLGFVNRLPGTGFGSLLVSGTVIEIQAQFVVYRFEMSP